jgi:outer membrane autotransporter protein
MMAVGENAKSNGKRSGTKKSLVTAVSMALLGLSGQAFAAPDVCSGINNSITSAETTACELGEDASVTVESSGSIIVIGSGSMNYAVEVRNSVIAGSITNKGTLSFTGGSDQEFGGAIRVQDASLTGGIVNTGTLSGNSVFNLREGANIAGGIDNQGVVTAKKLDASSAQALFVRAPSSDSDPLVTISGGFKNSGTITSEGKAARVGGLVLSGGFDNSGLMEGTDMAIEFSQTTLDEFTNSGTITADATAIGFSQTTLEEFTNSGTITAGAIGVGIGNQSSMSGRFTNTGVIETKGTSSTIQSAVYFVGNGADQVFTVSGGFENAGTISSDSIGILLGLTRITNGFDNSGLIQGQQGALIIANAGADDVINSGTINGGLTLVGGIVADSIENTGVINGVDPDVKLEFEIPRAAISVTQGSAIGTEGSAGGTITNSGTLSGAHYSILVDDTSEVVGGIIVEGKSSRLVGDVYAPTVGMRISDGAEFTNENAIRVMGLNISEGAVFNLTNATSTSADLPDTDFIATGNVNVGETGRVRNFGVVNVGSSGGDATPVITGNYVQESSGTFRTTVVSETQYGQMHVTGTAELAGTAEVVVSDAASVLADGGTLTDVIKADEGLSGEFDTITSESSIYSFTGLYSANAFGLQISAKSSAIEESASPYAVGAARVLDQLAANPGDMAPVLDTLNGLSGQDLTNAVDQTLPVVIGAASMAASTAQQAFNQVIQSRQSQLIGLSSGEEFAGNRDVWAKAFGSWANQGEIKSVPGYTVDSGGLAFGFDKQVSPKTNLGVGLAYAYSKVKSKSSAAPSDIDVNSYQLGIYGDYQLESDMQLNFQLDGAINTNSSSRSLSMFAGTPGVGSNATGSYNSYVGHVGVGLKKFMSIDSQTTFTPEVRLDYMTVQSDSYTESGGGPLNLKVNSQTYDTLYPSLDLRVDHALSNGLNLSANAGVAYNFLDTKAQITSAYQGGGASFVTNGLDVSPWQYNAGVGVSGMVSDNVELNVRYDIDFTSSSYTNQMVSARLKYFF